MKKRIIAIIALLAIALCALSACAKADYDFADKTYICEELVNDAAFTIKINADGTYVCTENSEFNTYEGTWSYKDGTITLKLKYDANVEGVNLFRVEDGDLVYIAEGSEGFSYTTFEDGVRFICIS